MDIAFKPSTGDSIQLATSHSAQTASLHFTAELTAHDHNKLIQDRARIQLWSDISHNGQSLSDGGWSALDLTYQAQTMEEMSLHKVSLGSTYHPSEKIVTLSLQVVAVLPMSRIPRFSFTYRIMYPSGDIQWLGAFGQNGSLLFERSNYDLHNFGLDLWTFDKSRMAHVYELVKQAVGPLVVARVRNVHNYCVRAMGPTSFVSDLKAAALLFFVPRSQPSAIGLSPTCVFSASPGVSLTLSADGHITASGPGTLLFQVNEDHSEPLTFIRQVLSHAKLERWNVLAWDADLRAIVLATPNDKFPIKAVTIPLWQSKGLIRPIYLETNTLSDMLGTTEFSIFSPDSMHIHLLTVDPQAVQKNQMVSLQTDSASNCLVMSPIYTLRGNQDKLTTIWKTVILSPYQVHDFPSDDSGTILPTPPPSPHLQPIARLSQAHATCNTSISSAPSLPLDASILPQTPISSKVESETLSSPSLNSDIDTHDTFPVQKLPNLPALKNILTMFISLYSMFFSIFKRFYWGHRTSGLPSRAEDQPRPEVSTGSENNVLRPLDDDTLGDPGDDFCASENLVKIPETDISLEGNIDTQVRPCQSYAEIPDAAVSGVSRASNNTKGGRDVYLQNEPSDSSSKKTTTIAILCMTHSDSSTAEANVIDKKDIMERCVQFLDGSEPNCVVSRCDVDVFGHGRVPGERQIGSGSSYSCCLLQYELDWGSDLDKSEREIRISPPSVDFVKF